MNDATWHQVIALDVALPNRIQVVDTGTVTAGYGRFQASLIPYLGDSLLLISRSAISVIDPTGGLVDWTPAKTQPLLTNIIASTVGVDPAWYSFISHRCHYALLQRTLQNRMQPR